MKQTIKKIIPESVLNTGKDVFDSLKRLGNIPDAYFSKERRDSIERLAALKDIHKGQRCFIMGNGPSLKNTDLSKLRNEITFGLKLYLPGFRNGLKRRTIYVSMIWWLNKLRGYSKFENAVS